MPTPPPEPPWGSTPPTFLSTRALAAAGLGRRRIAEAVASGRLIRVRRGRHVIAGAHPDIVSAAQLGGRVDCVSLLRHLGVFVLDEHALHIQVEVGASRLPRRNGVVRHWRITEVPREALVTDIVSALAQACRCQDARAAVATLDSAWHLGLIDERGIAEVFSRLPSRYRVLRNLLDPRSESGSETIMRLILRSLGCHIDIQVSIEGVGRVDFIVDGWLIIECDSAAHHAGWTQQKRDRRRDIAAAALGYTTIRPVAEDILYHREEVVKALKAVLEHRYRRVAVRNSSKAVAPSAQTRRITTRTGVLEEFRTAPARQLDAAGPQRAEISPRSPRR